MQERAQNALAAAEDRDANDDREAIAARRDLTANLAPFVRSDDQYGSVSEGQGCRSALATEGHTLHPHCAASDALRASRTERRDRDQ